MATILQGDASYMSFLASKQVSAEPVGFTPSVGAVQPCLFPFQRRVVEWAARRGRAAAFGDCGLGKTPMQLEWARLTCAHTSGNALILAPLAVSQQTVAEGQKFGVAVNACRKQSDVRPGISIANYEMLHHFDPEAFSAIVLDESSILKSYSGETRKEITAFASGIDYRLACTATPAPNDLIEIINHAEFLGIMEGKEIIALFFTQDGNSTHDWRLKGHAREDFWRWVASWAVAFRKPSDLGFPNGKFILPPLHIEEHIVAADNPTDRLFPVAAQALDERRKARRDSTADRVAETARIVAQKPGESWLIWCDLNDESEALAKAIPGAVEVRGSDSAEHKERAMLGFASGEIRTLVTKPSICGFGMNFQICANVVFVGLSDSYERFYQAVRRCWRFGQKRPVSVHLVIAETEGAVRENIIRKEREASRLMDQIVEHMQDLQIGQAAGREEMDYEETQASGNGWTLYLGDSCERIKEIADESVGLSIFSPPFPGMYVYTNSARDIGNAKTVDEMIEHFAFMVPDLLRVTMPGRICAVHLSQLKAMKYREGFVGMHDYRGRLIQLMIDGGWIYHGEVTIDKSPQMRAIRTKERGLLFKSLSTDSSVMHMALADYLIYFRKPGDNPEPINAGISDRYNPGRGWITQKEWIEWAAPVWYRQTPDYPGGIKETDVLNVLQAKETDDERHLCPLQLGVIERAVKLWSNPGDLVFDPFNGIGSTGFRALELGRRYVGIELKRSYYESAKRNLATAAASVAQPSLFAAQ